MTNRWKVDRLWMKRTVKDFIFYALKSLWMVSAAMKFKDTASWKKSPNKPSSVQFNSVAQLCLTLCDPMNHSMPGFPVHHQLPESTQTHVHWVGDAIQPSHPLLSPSPPALNLSQHQGLFQWVRPRQCTKKQRHHFTNKGPYDQSYGFPSSQYGCESWTIWKLNSEELVILNCGVGEDSWESPELQGDQTGLY